jgi:predicted nucleotidyltransferase component of viral defense system
MEQQIIEQAALKRGISIDAVIREYYEYLALRELYESGIGDKIVFKGGTALRIFYGCPRHSDGLDFSMSKEFGFEAFGRAVKAVQKKIPDMEIADLWNKRSTYICEYRIKEEWQAMAFSLKIEISKREKINRDKTELKLAAAEDFGIQVFGSVMKPEEIYNDKIRALAGRDEPKDYFDLWFLSQLLKRPFKPGKKADKKRYRQVLGKYLPVKYYKILEEIL